jgi:hypothetical protein
MRTTEPIRLYRQTQDGPAVNLHVFAVPLCNLTSMRLYPSLQLTSYKFSLYGIQIGWRRAGQTAFDKTNIGAVQVELNGDAAWPRYCSKFHNLVQDA